LQIFAPFFALFSVDRVKENNFKGIDWQNGVAKLFKVYFSKSALVSHFWGTPLG
jgi:hypothetical protein